MRMKDRTCCIEGCDKRVKGRGWCSAHYRRWQEFGNPLLVRAREYPNWAEPDPDGSCGVELCAKPAKLRGVCKSCYEYMRRNKTVLEQPKRGTRVQPKLGKYRAPLKPGTTRKVSVTVLGDGLARLEKGRSFRGKDADGRVMFGARRGEGFVLQWATGAGSSWVLFYDKYTLDGGVLTVSGERSVPVASFDGVAGHVRLSA